MAKWAFLFCVLLFWDSGLAQSPVAHARRPAADTVTFSFDLLDWHRGDTVYLRAIRPETAAPVINWTIRRYFQKHISGVYHGDSIVSGKVILYFVADTTGKIIRSGYDPTTSDPELANEVLHVVNAMNRSLQMAPTMISGESVVSTVRLKVLFKEIGKPYRDNFQADLVVEAGPVMR